MLDLLGIHEANGRLMDQRGGLESLARFFARQLSRRRARATWPGSGRTPN